MSQDVLSPRQLAEEARAHLARPQEWISRVRLRAEGRWYERILMADTYDVRLIRPVDCTFRGISVQFGGCLQKMSGRNSGRS